MSFYGLWQAATLVSPCCHTCCKNHYPLEMLFRIKNWCRRYLTAGSAGQTQCETECFHATGGSLPSFITAGMLADRQGVNTIIAPVRLRFTFKSFSWRINSCRCKVGEIKDGKIKRFLHQFVMLMTRFTYWSHDVYFISENSVCVSVYFLVLPGRELSWRRW